MSSLPPCRYREPVPGANQFKCHHPGITTRNNLVASIICRTCSLHEEGGFIGASDSDRVMSMRHLASQEIEGSVSTWCVGVTTAPRHQPTLQDTLNSLKAAGWLDLTIFAEPNTPQPDLEEGHVWCVRGRQLGMFSNWYLSLTEMVLTSPDADAFMLCQDDVQFSHGLRGYLEDSLWCGTTPQVVSVYTAEVHENPDRSGFSRLNAGWGTCGALALIFPNVVAYALLSDPMILQYRISGPLNGCIDSLVGAWCEARGIDYYIHSPSLAQHTGIQTTGYGLRCDSPRRSASSFLGSIQNLPCDQRAEIV